MSASSYPDTADRRPVAWFARPVVVAGLILVAVAWAVYLVVTVVSDPDLSSLEEASGYEFRYDPAVLVGVALIGMVIPAIICFFKGKVGMGLGGLVVPGVSLAGAVRSAKPASLWVHRFPPAGGPVERSRVGG